MAQQNVKQDVKQSKHGGEQYFNATPTSADVRVPHTFTVRGHEVQVNTSHGVFSADRVDLGTQVLLRHAPDLPETGTFLDLGSGWGPIALAMALDAPDARVYAVDVNERSIDLTRENAQANGCANIVAGTAQDVPDDVRFARIWSNPPIRIGKEALHELLMTWLPRLEPDGYAYLVVQKNLGADSLMPWLAQQLGDEYEVSKYSSSKGYRVIEVHRVAA
ncbi:class I SAM-dependent methyltransferase [Bifidobacterium gallicum]|uniref:16S RNA methylase RsmC n=1 Tax=Bifidobacterium gallicum DSM 20093 = LMG 11596 TaxID=561180 RepID=D1NSU9_9BIFI|nr:methyltransferase [Bifidobacterium gallicum]EFA23751.1 methyltransferase small domain protein [Bifidobacterium gallicum DSM 20093 = LMG 11596]KFI59232.1 16S RNA methylase RsmC [Bifidobacterium gallicum DSM 20093 = LMG 11596]